MRNTVIDLKQKKTIKTIDIYRVVDLESGEEVDGLVRMYR